MFNFAKVKCLILIVIISFAIEAHAQNDAVDFQTWTDVTFAYFFKPKLSVGGDVGLRGIVSSKDWNLFYIRPTINYTVSPVIKISGGVGSFNTFNNTLGNAYEIRLFQDAHISWPDIGWVDFYHRIRFEERFFFYEKLENDSNIRGRYLFRARTIDFKLLGEKKSFYLKGMWEVFVPIGKSATELFVNNQRYYAAIGHRSSDRLRFELFYIWQQSRELSDDGFQTSEHIIRLRFFYTLKLPDQE